MRKALEISNLGCTYFFLFLTSSCLVCVTFRHFPKCIFINFQGFVPEFVKRFFVAKLTVATPVKLSLLTQHIMHEIYNETVAIKIRSL